MGPTEQRGSYDRPFRHAQPLTQVAQPNSRILLQQYFSQSIPQGRDPRRSPVASQPPASLPTPRIPPELPSRPPGPGSATPPPPPPPATQESTAFLQSPPVSGPTSIPATLIPLVQVLRDLERSGDRKPFRSIVATRLTAFDPGVYKKAVVTCWRDYALKAVNAGFVILGNDEGRPGYDWITLSQMGRSAELEPRSPTRIDTNASSSNYQAAQSSVRGEKPVFWLGGSTRNSPRPSTADDASSARPHYYDKAAAWTQSFIPTPAPPTDPALSRPAPQSTQVSVDSNPGEASSPGSAEADSPVSSVTTSSASTSSLSASSSSTSSAPAQGTHRVPSPPQPTSEAELDKPRKSEAESCSSKATDATSTRAEVHEPHCAQPQSSLPVQGSVTIGEIATGHSLPTPTIRMDVDADSEDEASSPPETPAIGLGIRADGIEDDDRDVFYPKIMPSVSPPSGSEAPPSSHLPPSTLTKMVDLLCSSHVDNLRATLETENQEYRASVEAMVSREIEARSQQIRNDFAAQLEKHRAEVTSQMQQLRSEQRSRMDSLRTEVHKQVESISAAWVADAAATKDSLLTATRQTLETSLDASLADRLHQANQAFRTEMSGVLSVIEKKADVLSQQVDDLKLSRLSDASASPVVPHKESSPSAAMPSGMKSSASPPPKVTVQASTSSALPAAPPQSTVPSRTLNIPPTLATPVAWSQFFADLCSKMQADLAASTSASAEPTACAAGLHEAPSEDRALSPDSLNVAPKSNSQAEKSSPSLASPLSSAKDVQNDTESSAGAERPSTTPRSAGHEQMLEVSLGCPEIQCDDDGDTAMSPMRSDAKKTIVGATGPAATKCSPADKVTADKTTQLARSIKLPVKPVTIQQSKSTSRTPSGATSPVPLETRLSAATSTLPSKPDRPGYSQNSSVRDAVAAMRRDSGTPSSGSSKRSREGAGMQESRSGAGEASGNGNSFKKPRVSDRQNSVLQQRRADVLQGSLSTPIPHPHARSENDEEDWDKPLSPASFQLPTTGMADSWRPGEPLRAPVNFKVQGLADRRRLHNRDDDPNSRDDYRGYHRHADHSRPERRASGTPNGGHWRSYHDQGDRFDSSSTSEPSPFRAPRDSESPDPLQVDDNGEVIFQPTTTTTTTKTESTTPPLMRSLTIKGSAVDDSPGNASPRAPMSTSTTGAGTAPATNGGASALLSRISS